MTITESFMELLKKDDPRSATLRVIPNIFREMMIIMLFELMYTSWKGLNSNDACVYDKRLIKAALIGGMRALRGDLFENLDTVIDSAAAIVSKIEPEFAYEISEDIPKNVTVH